MTAFNVFEDFRTITDLRKGLAGLDARFRRRQRAAGDNLCVDVVTEHGKPVATVMPYETYTRIRDLLLLAKAQADVAAGRVISFPAGTTAEQALDAIFSAKDEGRAKARKAV